MTEVPVEFPLYVEKKVFSSENCTESSLFIIQKMPLKICFQLLLLKKDTKESSQQVLNRYMGTGVYCEPN